VVPLVLRMFVSKVFGVSRRATHNLMTEILICHCWWNKMRLKASMFGGRV
jgi:hypothetical protein